MAQLSYPGVYVQEIPSGVHTITGVSTSITAFVDDFSRGTVEAPQMVQGWSEFERYFGGLSANSISSYCIQQFFLNGGSQAIIVRAKSSVNGQGPVKASFTANPGGNTWGFEAFSEGKWGNNIRLKIMNLVANGIFDLSIELLSADCPESERSSEKAPLAASEFYKGISKDTTHLRNVQEILKESSELVRFTGTSTFIDASFTIPDGDDADDQPDDASISSYIFLKGGLDNQSLDEQGLKNALDKLKSVDLFNILCLPVCVDHAHSDTFNTNVYAYAKTLCEDRRAFLIEDIDKNQTFDSMKSYVAKAKSKNTAIFYPRIHISDSLNAGRAKEIPVSGTLAGLFSRTDATRGVWKAPAGVEALINGIIKLKEELNDENNGLLNPLGVNCLRRFPIYGNINWGSRTTVGSDQEGSEWKYIPIRRLALYLEESLFRGTKWVVFEPNDEPLWAQIRQSVGAFMMDMFRQGAFQGSTPAQAFYVRCDATTTLPIDRQRGVVNIEVGFAPLKPAEFVVLKFQQISSLNNN